MKKRVKSKTGLKKETPEARQRGSGGGEITIEESWSRRERKNSGGKESGKRDSKTVTEGLMLRTEVRWGRV